MKTILVTGAAGDIGKAITIELTKANRVIGVVRTKDSSSALSDIKNLTLHVADVSNPNDIAHIKKAITEKIDWIVTAHGYIDPETNLEKELPENLEKMFRVNSLSLLYLAQAFISNISGAVFISSTAGISANGNFAGYSASKAAANSLAQAFARNRATQTFISVCPGPTAGKMRASIGATGGQDPHEIAKVVKEIIDGKGDFKSGDILSVRDGKTVTASRLS